MSRTIEDVLNQYQPVLSRAGGCLTGELGFSDLNEELYLDYCFTAKQSSSFMYRDEAIRLCAHLCTQFLVHPDELKKVMAPLAIKLDAIAEEMGVDISFDGVDDVN